MAAPQLGGADFASTDHSRLWEHLNRSRDDVDAMLAANFDDTGWISQATGYSGFADIAGYRLQRRKIGKRCTLRGMVQWTSGVFQGNAMAVMPAGWIPTESVWLGLHMLTGSKALVTLLLEGGTGKVSVPAGTGYINGAVQVNDLIAIHASWLVD